LPAGLMLSTGGAITGTPTATGAFTFTVQATDSSAAPGPYPGLQTFTLVVTPPGFSYNSTTQVLTITSSSGGNSFTFTQAAGGIDSFVFNGTPFSLPESLLSTVQVNVAGTGNVASFSTLGEVAPEAIRVGNGGGRVQHLDAQGIPHDFLIATGFQNTSAAVTHADQGFIDSTPGVKNVFVGAGIYSYMNTGNNAEDFYYITGAKFVYGYASGPGDFAYQYDGSGPSYYTVSGVADRIMFETDAGVIFQNYAMGFVFNEGIANHPGQDTATFYDSPSNDQFTGFTYYSSMTSANGTFAENDIAVYFAQVYAYSFVGGFDRATVYDANVNHVFGFH